MAFISMVKNRIILGGRCFIILFVILPSPGALFGGSRYLGRFDGSVVGF